jgi:hypothetical protein
VKIPQDTRSGKTDRDTSIREEQDLCKRAMDSDTYDSMSDNAWVALCEQVATNARQVPGQEPGTTLTQECDAFPMEPQQSTPANAAGNRSRPPSEA